MRRIGYYMRRATELPPRTVLRKARARMSADLTTFLEQARDGLRSSYATRLPRGDLASFLETFEADALEGSQALLDHLAGQYCAHRFDLLGSGWTHVAHGKQCRGVEGCVFPHGPEIRSDRDGNWLDGKVSATNLQKSRRIWQLIDDGYEPIDWQLDFKSGYRWSATVHSSTIPAWGNPPGADIKVPWELARCEHLPQIALAHLCSRDRTLASEFRNQVLDFTAQNPPRFGVNWVCTMDVSIRIANWLLARDLLCGAGGVSFDASFESIMLRSTYEHARHIATHLEWSDTVRGNHYLANICGLLFAAAYLPPGAQADLWLAFAVQELVAETRRQFYEEGANFEASSSYHRLSAELVVYATAVALGLPAERVQRLARVPARPVARGPRYEGLEDILAPSRDALAFPAWFGDRLERMAEFVVHLTRDDGRTIQFGDNDNGRLFKLPGAYQLVTARELRQRYRQLHAWHELHASALCPDEDVLDHRHLVAAVGGLIDRADCGRFHGEENSARAIVAALARGRTLVASPQHGRALQVRVGDHTQLAHAQAQLEALPESHRQSYLFPLPAAGEQVATRLFGYRGFGLYGWRQDRWSAWLRCGRVGTNGIGGHAHNDALALELEIDGVAVARDPGTYLYTALPEARNRYRSAAAHFVPRVAGREPASLAEGLFALPEVPGLACLYFGLRGFVGVHDGFGKRVMRIVLIEPSGIRVVDGSWGEPLERCVLPSPVEISPKYGCQLYKRCAF